ncbi:MAG: putative T7SS-secreted protein [Haloechinothrix sp.]
MSSPVSTADSFPALGFDPAPGALNRVTEAADKYRTVSQKLQFANGALSDILNQTGTWEGEASEAFARRVGDLPEYLDTATRSMSQASGALTSWESELAEMKRRAAELELEARRGAEAAKKARSNPDFALANQTFYDQQALQHAQALLDNAGRQLEDAISACHQIQEQAKRLYQQHTEVAERIADLVKRARELAPDEPGVLAKGLEALGDLAGEIANDVIDTTRDAIRAVTDFIEDNAQLISNLSDVVGDISTILGVVSDFLPEPAGIIVGGISVGLGVTALQGHLVARAAGADVPDETIALDLVGVTSGTVGLIPGFPSTLMRFSGTALVAGQAAGELATGGEGSTFFDNVGKYWAPRNDRQLATYAAAVATMPIGGIGIGAAYAVPFENAAHDGIEADNATQPERDRQRAEDRVWE